MTKGERVIVEIKNEFPMMVEKQYGVVFFEHFRMEDVEEICHGIDDVYMKRFPKLTETQHINLIPEELMPTKKK